MIPEKELDLLNSCLNTSFASISFVNNRRALNNSVRVFNDYIGADFGFIISFSNQTYLFFKWTEDAFGDPYRVELWNAENLNKDAVNIEPVLQSEFTHHLKGKKLSHYEILSYQSSYKIQGVDGFHSVTWGIELDFDGTPLFLGILSSESPFESGTTREMLASTNILFGTEMKMMFEGYLGFYGEL